MVDIVKLFEILKSKSDVEAQAEIASLLHDETDFKALLEAGFKVPQTNNNNTGYNGGFGFSGNQSNQSNSASDADLKECSLFAYALAHNRYHAAGFLLTRLGVKILLKMNDKKENGFHAVAKSDNTEFRMWFLKDSIAATMAQADPELFKTPINQVVTVEKPERTDHNVFTLGYHSSVTPQEVDLWIRLGANPLYTGIKPGNYLHFCCEKLRKDLVQYLAQNHRNLMFSPNEKGQFPVQAAFGPTNIECLEVLTQAGSPLCGEDRLLNRPLHHAIVKGALPAAQYILQNQQYVLCGSKSIPYVNVGNGAKETPLHLLMTYNKVYSEKAFQEALDLLIAYGADTAYLNEKDLSPLMLARDLVKAGTMTPQIFNIVWLKLQEKYNPQLFTRDTLFFMIQQSLPPQQSHAIIQTLAPVLVNQAPDPFRTLDEHHANALRQLVYSEYREQPQMIEPFLGMLNHLEQVRQKNQQAQLTNQRVNFQYQTQSDLKRNLSDTEMLVTNNNNNFNYNNRQ